MYDRILQTIKRKDSEVRLAVACGSRVYGTASPGSDEDYFVVLGDPKAKQDLAFGKGINVVIHGIDAFTKALSDQSVFALECFFAPDGQRFKDALPRMAVKCDNAKLLGSAKGRSNSDFAKAKKRYDDEPGPSKKKVFHSIRVLTFAREMAEAGRISDFAAANDTWAELSAMEGASWAEIEEYFGPVRDQLLRDLEALVKRR